MCAWHRVISAGSGVSTRVDEGMWQLSVGGAGDRQRLPGVACGVAFRVVHERLVKGYRIRSVVIRVSSSPRNVNTP
jgi:hypothetical protein